MNTNIEATENKTFVLYDSDPTEDWFSEEEYRECCGIPEDEEIDFDSYWCWVSDCLDNNWTMFKDAMEKHLSGTMCAVFGNVGRWDGDHEIIPELFCDDDCPTLAAIKKCCDINGEHFEMVSLEEDGTLSIQVHHHDGTDCFTLKKIVKDSEEDVRYLMHYGEDEEVKLENIKYGKYTLEEFEY